MSVERVKQRMRERRKAGIIPPYPTTLPLTPVATPIKTAMHPLPCIHEGGVIEWCESCGNKEARNVRDCSVHDKCTRGYVSSLVQSCNTCSSYSPQALDNSPQPLQIAINPEPVPHHAIADIRGMNDDPNNTIHESNEDSMARRRRHPIRYAYGVTTVPDRRAKLLPKTLASLRSAGFDTPTLFVDGDSNCDSWREEFKLEVTCRYPVIRTFGNWSLSIAELFIRDPHADRYCMFQDDFITYPNLRAYLDTCEYPDDGYWNLYTFPKNQRLAPKDDKPGWYKSNQRGLGAVALIFSRGALTTLLAQPHLVNRPIDLRRGWRAVDGGIVTAMNKAGYKEYVHNPSLVQHTGLKSSMKNHEQPLAESFRGEGFDATQLIADKVQTQG